MNTNVLGRRVRATWGGGGGVGCALDLLIIDVIENRTGRSVTGLRQYRHCYVRVCQERWRLLYIMYTGLNNTKQA